MKSEKIIIVGKTASGKNYLANYLVDKKGFKRDITYTTRPIRINEKNNVEYNFINESEFLSMADNNKFYEYMKYETNNGDWFYGSIKDNWNTHNIFIKTPGGISKINTEDRKKCFIVYLDIDPDIRKERLLERNDNNDSIDRRFKTDDRDFEKFDDYDLRISDPDYDLEMVYDLMD